MTPDAQQPEPFDPKEPEWLIRAQAGLPPISKTIEKADCLTCERAVCENEETHTRFKYCPVVDHFVLMWFDGKYIPYTQTAQDIVKCGCASHTRTRPHTPAPEKVFVMRNGIPRGLNGIQGFDGVDYDKPFNVHSRSYFKEIDLAEYDAAIARTATLAILNDLMATVSDCDVGGNCAILKKIGSLRQQAGEQQ
jgi:hypothetical protein